MLEESWGGSGGGVEYVNEGDDRLAYKILMVVGVKSGGIPDDLNRPEDGPNFIRPTDDFKTHREKWIEGLKRRFEAKVASGRVPTDVRWTDEAESSLQGISDISYDEFLANVIHRFGSLEAGRQHITQLGDGGEPAPLFKFVVAKPNKRFSEADVRCCRNNLLSRIGKGDPQWVHWANPDNGIYNPAGRIVAAGVNSTGKLVASVAAVDAENAGKLRERQGSRFWVSIVRPGFWETAAGGPRGAHIDRVLLAQPGEKAVQLSDTPDTTWIQFSGE